MTKRVTKYGAIAILILMTLLTTGCVIVTTINTGHHIKSSRVAENVIMEQGYETDISGKFIR